jgi:uncharacterized protein (TIGR03437 family)
MSGTASFRDLCLRRGHSLVLLLCSAAISPAFAQQVTLSVGSGSATPGSAVALNVSLATSSASPTGLQWTFNYPADITGVTLVPSAAATAAGKLVTCAASSGSTTCILYGMTATVVPNGAIATATFTISAASVSTTIPITLSAMVASTGLGASIPMSGSGGTIAVTQLPPVLSGLSCSPASVNAPGSSACTATLSKAAPTGGFAVTLASNNANATVPASVTVSAGTTTSGFTVTVASVATNQTAVVTASANGVSQTFSVSLVAAAAARLSSLTCAPSSLGTGQAAVCTVTLTKAATSSATISLASSSTLLPVAASMTITAGSTTGTFTATAGTVSASSSATLTATFAGQSSTATVALSAPAAVSGLTCTPASVNAPGTTSCTVTLTKVAPTGGMAVALSSNNASLTVPASVTVAAAASSAVFTATAAAVTSNQTAVVTASANGASQTFSVSLVAAAAAQLSSLTCAPSSLGTGQAAVCTVTLTKAATSSAAINLASSSTLLPVPASMTINAGSSTGTFTATAGTVSANSSATLTATYAGQSSTSVVALSAPAAGQVTMSVGSGSATPGSTVALQLSMVASGASPSGLQWTLNYPADVTGVTLVPSAAATAAGKLVTCMGSSGSTRCILYGMTATVVPNGAVATATFTISPASTSTSIPIAFSGAVAAGATGNSIPMSGTGGTIAVTQPQGWSISGTITPASQGGGVTVSMTGGATSTATADGSGNFTLTGLLNGTYQLTPSKTGLTFSPQSKSITVNGANVTGVAFAATIGQTYATPLVDAQISKDQATTSVSVTSPAFSTSTGNELLLALIATDGTTRSNTIVNSVSGGGLTWVLVGRTRAQSGTAEIWRAFSASALNSVSVTAALSKRVTSSMTVMSFSGVDTTGSNGSGAVGATGTANGTSGAPTASLVTTRSNSVVLGVGDDPTKAIARTLGSGQSLVHQYLAPNARTYWVQSLSAPTAQSGNTATVNDSAPTADAYNLTTVEVLGAPIVLTPQFSVSMTGTAKPKSIAAVSGAVGSQSTAPTLSSLPSDVAGEACSPGGLVTLKGSGFTDQAAQQSTSYPLPTQLAGIRVTVNGQAMPLLFASSSQINLQCPALPEGSALQIAIVGASGSSAQISSTMQAVTPDLFTMVGTTQGIVQIGGTNELAMQTTEGIPSRPVRPGESLTIYASGLGETQDPVLVGSPAPLDRPVLARNSVSVSLGNAEVATGVASLVPGTVGVWQIDVQVPVDAPAGPAVPVGVRVTLPDGRVVGSNSVTVAISPGVSQ